MLKMSASITTYNDGLVRTQDGVELYYREWIPASAEVNSVVLFIHGIGLHSGSPPYGEKILIKQLLDRGTAFYSIDLRGHGRSGGAIDGILPHTLIQDINSHVKRIMEVHKNARIFLYGHNFGGILSLYYASLFPHDVRGVIVSEYSKLIKEGMRKLREPNAIIAIKDLISEKIYHRSKKFEFLTPEDYERLCDKYHIPLDTGIMGSLETSGSADKHMLYGRDFFSACGVGRETRIAKSTTVPVLMIFSRKDAFFDIKGAYDIITRIASYDKELIQVDAAGHYSIIEASRDVVSKWILARA
jgi:alpha-beta hydrolase superfamily lysophospholipase